MPIIRNSRCRGSGMCEDAAPEFFEIQDDGTMEILRQGPFTAEERAELARAFKACPMAALSLDED